MAALDGIPTNRTAIRLAPIQRNAPGLQTGVPSRVPKGSNPGLSAFTNAEKTQRFFSETPSSVDSSTSTVALSTSTSTSTIKKRGSQTASDQRGE